MKIFVTGGNGFIGHQLVRSLLDDGHEVKVIDTSTINFTHEKLTFIKKSVEDDLRFMMSDTDVVFHLAALLGVETSDNNPLRTLRVNIDGTVNLFKCAHEVGVKKIIYSSSSEVYGEAREIPLKEDSPKAPVSVYGVSKLAAEMYAQAYTKEYGIDINPVRFFNVYGPAQGFDWVIPRFIRSVLHNKQPTVYGDGSQVRCFTFIKDIISGMRTVMESGKKGEAYNIANSHPITMKELAELVISISKKNLKPAVLGFGEKTRAREREIMKRVPSIEKLQKIGWQPTVSIEEGLRETYSWYEKNIDTTKPLYDY